MMSFPIDYRFYGNTKATKHTLVGNAVPPKMSFAIAKAIANDIGFDTPKKYRPIKHNEDVDFLNLNGQKFPLKKEHKKRIKSNKIFKFYFQ